MRALSLFSGCGDKHPLTLGSLFDGIGGFPLAASSMGIKPVWASEIERAPISITRRHFPDMKHLGDITKINGAEIEPVDVITFGSPCQDLSVAGSQKGLSGERSGLFLEAVRIIKEMRKATNGSHPTFAVWENVPGAFSSNKGGDFQTVIEEIASIQSGFVPISRPSDGWKSSGCIVGDDWSIAWRVLDAQFWGVPQRRRRIFLVADFAGRRAAQILFKREGMRGHHTASGASGEGTAADPCGNAKSAGFGETGAGYWRDGIQCLRAEGENRPSRPSNVVVGASGTDYLTGWDCQEKRVFTATGVAPTLSASDGQGGRTGVGYIFDARGNGNGAVSSCLTGDHQNRITDYTALCVELFAAGFCAGASMSAGGIGYAEGCAATLKAGNSGTNRPAVVFGFKSFGHYKTAKTIMACDDVTTGDLVAGIDCRNGAENGDMVGTLQAHTGGGTSLNCTHPVRIGYSVRRLTPTECERLQGFPDGWTESGDDGKPISDSARYKALGNSVAIPCVAYVLQGIVEADETMGGWEDEQD